MPRSMSGGQLTVLNSDVIPLCTCWEIRLSTGDIIRVTNHDQPVKALGKVFTPGGPNMSSSRREVSLQTRTKDLSGFIDTDLISDEDIRKGKLRGSPIWEYVVNYEDGSVFLSNLYWIQMLQYDVEMWKAGTVSIADWLRRSTGNLYSRVCRHRLGYGICGIGVSLAGITESAAVTAIVHQRTAIKTDLPSHPDKYYAEGQVTFTSGANEGISVQIRGSANIDSVLDLWVEVPYDIAIGDTFDIYPGCDGNFSTCKDKFNNVENFGGFPHIIGTDQMLDSATGSE